MGEVYSWRSLTKIIPAESLFVELFVEKFKVWQKLLVERLFAWNICRSGRFKSGKIIREKFVNLRVRTSGKYSSEVRSWVGKLLVRRNCSERKVWRGRSLEVCWWEEINSREKFVGVKEFELKVFVRAAIFFAGWVRPSWKFRAWEIVLVRKVFVKINCSSESFVWEINLAG